MNIKYFNIAKEVSKLSDFKRIKIGCCIVLKHEVIATGYNTKKSHPLQAKLNHLRFNDHFDECNHYIHAELRAILSCRDIDLNKATIIKLSGGVDIWPNDASFFKLCVIKGMKSLGE